VATPTSCPHSSGTTVGRRSPWVGHVDVSVYVADGATAAERRALQTTLRRRPEVAHVYVETKKQAYAEFQRLYSCSAEVPRSALPASFRLVLGPATRPERDALVRAIARLPDVRSVSCDPGSPCVDVAAGG
jgi:cell division protein FtsX